MYLLLVKFFKNVAQPYGTRIRPTIDSLKNHIRRIDARTGFHNTNGIATVQLGTRKVHEDVMDVKDFFAAMNGQLQVQSSTSDTVLDLLRSIVSAKTPGELTKGECSN